MFKTKFKLRKKISIFKFFLRKKKETLTSVPEIEPESPRTNPFDENVYLGQSSHHGQRDSHPNFVEHAKQERTSFFYPAEESLNTNPFMRIHDAEYKEESTSSQDIGASFFYSQEEGFTPRTTPSRIAAETDQDTLSPENQLPPLCSNTQEILPIQTFSPINIEPSNNSRTILFFMQNLNSQSKISRYSSLDNSNHYHPRIARQTLRRTKSLK